MTARAIAAAVAAGVTSALEAADAALARIAAYDAVQPQVWIERLDPEVVHAYARAVDARIAAGEVLPLAGATFAIKDNIDLAGLPTTAGCPDFAYAPEASAVVVQRLIAAGAIPVGKTNLDQFATGLNGTRSPHGAPHCVFNRAFVSGGSSSGSAVAVGAGLVDFALGTDTAGSGRVPAAFNNLVGFKPTKGRWSTSGLMPACRSLDCISVFTHDLDDAELVDAVAAGFDAADPFSRPLEDRPRGAKRLGVPLPQQRNFLGDATAAYLYEQALERFAADGAEIVPIDIDFLSEAAQLLYGGPWVAERTTALKTMLAEKPDAIDPTVRTIVEAGLGVTAVELFEGEYRLKALARRAEAMWDEIDLLVLPTAPTAFRIAEMKAEPIRLNAALGLYTNFVNLLDMSALAVPAGFRGGDVGFGVTLIGPAHADRALIAAARPYLARPDAPAPVLDLGDKMETVTLAVVGAHLEGMPLHWQLTSRNARFLGAAKTADSYRLYAIANSTPPKPALVFSEGGAPIAVELYELDLAAFGSFTAEVPAPLAIGSVTLDDGRTVKGFVAEPRALDGATEITGFGGWRAYIASL
ncbi:allophanate hydrolase [Caulobacter sp. D5]|uniref:allophanate hydrolase n=1 Tax=Caulobacter sp. D5 TaxID=357400 RepID=UPI0018EE84D0|nr:allophanate hydrolase [Caulobacter sp. D5]